MFVPGEKSAKNKVEFNFYWHFVQNWPLWIFLKNCMALCQTKDHCGCHVVESNEEDTSLGLKWIYFLLLQNRDFVVYKGDHGLIIFYYFCAHWSLLLLFIFFFKMGYVVALMASFCQMVFVVSALVISGTTVRPDFTRMEGKFVDPSKLLFMLT